MVDVTGKQVTQRSATASGHLRTTAEVVALLRGPGVTKGDALAVAPIAAILATKRTSEMIPLCHPVAIQGSWWISTWWTTG